MTITEAIARLHALKDQCGEKVLVYFDCPKCGESFTPDVVVGAAVHMSHKPKK